MQRSLLCARSQSNHRCGDGAKWAFRRRSCVHLTGEPSCKDEARVGQKNGLVRQWARRARQPADQHYESAYLFGAICPARGRRRASVALRRPPRPCSFTSMRSPATSQTAPTPCRCSTAPDGTPPPSSTCRATSRDLPAVARAGAESGREHLAVPARQLALQPRLRNLRCNHRSRLRRLAQTHRPARNHHLNRNARLGARRSDVMTAGIMRDSGRKIRLGRLTLTFVADGVDRTGWSVLLLGLRVSCVFDVVGALCWW
jgi:hypothetical protein